MSRMTLLLLGMCTLAGCGIGEATSGGVDDQQLGQKESQSSSRPDSGTFKEGPAPADAGTPPPPPPPPPSLCPAGQTPVYRYVADQAAPTGTRISAGPGGALMTMTCETTSCGSRSVEVVEEASSMGTTDLCVPPPPDCPTGEYANYVPPTNLFESPTGYDPTTGMTPGEWKCSGPCALLVKYGAMFGTRMVCAPPPPPSCPAGLEPIFIVESETWECQTACSGGKYDPTQYQGRNICVPC